MALNQISIDAIIQTPDENVSGVVSQSQQRIHTNSQHGNPNLGEIDQSQEDQPQTKRKSARRFLSSLSRISSSPSLAKMSKLKPYTSGLKASINLICARCPSILVLKESEKKNKKIL